jgi:hypothetical protein
MNQPEIIVKVKDVYGQATVYPVCVLAEEFAKLAGTKTLTRAALNSIRAIGFKVTLEVPSYEI